MSTHTIVGVFDSEMAAEAARAALLEAGVADDRISLSADLTKDAIAGEAPGQSYENQPGQPPSDSATAKYGDAVRSGARTLTVAVTSQTDGKHIAQLLRKKGARRTFDQKT